MIFARIACHKRDGRDRSLSQKKPGFNYLLLPKDGPEGQIVAGARAARATRSPCIKTTDSALTGTNLRLILHNMGIKDVICVGIFTDQCVSSTVRSLVDESFGVIVVDDCCAAATMELHRHELEIINMIYCHVVQLDELQRSSAEAMSGSLYERDQRALSRMSFLRFFPQAVIGGEGAFLIGDDGRRLLDFSASWGAAASGTRIRPCATRSTARFPARRAPATSRRRTCRPSSSPNGCWRIVPERARGRVWLGHSGSDANETVARAVVAATGRPRMLAFHGAYHGGTSGSMAISGHPVQQGVPKAPGLTLVRYPEPLSRRRRRGGGDARPCRARGAVRRSRAARRGGRDVPRADPVRRRHDRAARRLFPTLSRRCAAGTASCWSATR